MHRTAEVLFLWKKWTEQWTWSNSTTQVLSFYSTCAHVFLQNVLETKSNMICFWRLHSTIGDESEVQSRHEWIDRFCFYHPQHTITTLRSSFSIKLTTLSNHTLFFLADGEDTRATISIAKFLLGTGSSQAIRFSLTAS